MTAEKINRDMTIGQTHIELQRAIMKNACMQDDVAEAVLKLLNIEHGDPYVVKQIDEVVDILENCLKNCLFRQKRETK